MINNILTSFKFCGYHTREDNPTVVIEHRKRVNFMSSSVADTSGGGGGGETNNNSVMTADTPRFSVHTLDKATKAKVTLENYYNNLISQHKERKGRLMRLEQSLADETMSESQRLEKRQQHAVKETEYLRFKRSRLGVDDFVSLKVIGRGAFGEVRKKLYITHIIGKS